MASFLALALAFAAGCASATTNQGTGTSDAPNNTGGDGNNGPQDAPAGRDGKIFLDAPIVGPDAAMPITVTDTNDDTLLYGGSIACGDNGTGSTRDNIWYRAYQLSDYPAITGGFHVTQVDVEIQDALSSSAITVKLGTYTGALDGATLDTTKITTVAMGNVTPPNTSGQNGEMVHVPMTANLAAGSKFVVEVVAPDMDSGGSQHALYIGTTQAVEKHSGYWSTSVSACGPSTPETMSAAGASGHLIIDVEGTH